MPSTTNWQLRPDIAARSMPWPATLTVVGCHVGGEVGKVVVAGIPDAPGTTMFDKMQHLATHHDDIRRIVLFEPRGAAVHSVNYLLPPTSSRADMGFVIAESTEYPVMSGGNTICTATVLLETGILPISDGPVTRIVLESPAGLIPVECATTAGKVTGVRFTNQPAFVYALSVPVEVAGLGTVAVDVAWGGMAYALVDAAALGFALTADEARDLATLGQGIKAAAAEQVLTVHPEHPEFAGITQTEFMGPVRLQDGLQTARNAVVVSPGRIDRSPCGTGTSARLALMHRRGQIGLGAPFIHESIVGSRFTGTITELTAVGDIPAVVPTISGQAWITEFSYLGVHPTDPFPEGYTASDTW